MGRTGGLPLLRVLQLLSKPLVSLTPFAVLSPKAEEHVHTSDGANILRTNSLPLGLQAIKK